MRHAVLLHIDCQGVLEDSPNDSFFTGTMSPSHNGGVGAVHAIVTLEWRAKIVYFVERFTLFTPARTDT